ncbi:PLP-dependent aminotransferase family protein [Actinocorallia longicatena]|uniref:PLP-dependent aminotransferase family protein n=1 Tax=Actinocorallia longicatena TaxID=111803 RepID=A0ABP6PZ35_9ACTN
MARRAADLPLSIDRAAEAPLTVQLVTALRDAMCGGSLHAGERLPATRALAADLAVSRTVVTEAYQQLYAEGWLEGRHGSGTFVAGHAPPPAVAETPPAPPRGGPSRAEARARELVDLRPGTAWTPGIDEAVWRRALRAAGTLRPDVGPDPHGLPRLRELVAEHLRRARGVRVGPENVLITRGTGNGLDLVAALYAAGRRAGVEEPGYRVARNVLAARGATVVPCPVDTEGILAGSLPGDLALLYTTPAHQWPLGGRLPIPRRERLLAWAREHDALIIEDDYDAEFRYDVAPLPALYGLDPSRVILLGTLSKTLAPDLGIGWLVARPGVIGRVAALRGDLADRTPGPSQLAAAHLLAGGDLDRHLRRMRLEYARRRALVVELLGPHLTGDTAGLHVMLPLPDAASTAALVGRAAERGILLEDTVRHSHAAPTAHGVILGYGSASPTDLRRACVVLAGLLRSP